MTVHLWPRVVEAVTAASPALPPEEEKKWSGRSSVETECRRMLWRTRLPMPRILNEPDGCMFSSLRNMRLFVRNQDVSVSVSIAELLAVIPSCLA